MSVTTNIHCVTKFVLGPIETQKTEGGVVYAVRMLKFRSEDGTDVEINLFADSHDKLLVKSVQSRLEVMVE